MPSISPNSAVRPRSLSLVNFTTDIPRDPKVPKNRRMLCRRIGAETFSMQAHRTTPTGSVRDTSTGFLLTYIMLQCVCCSTKRRRVAGSSSLFPLPSLPASSSLFYSSLAVLCLSSSSLFHSSLSSSTLFSPLSLFLLSLFLSTFFHPSSSLPSPSSPLWFTSPSPSFRPSLTLSFPLQIHGFASTVDYC
jgi:hypothetical protein